MCFKEPAARQKGSGHTIWERIRKLQHQNHFSHSHVSRQATKSPTVPQAHENRLTTLGKSRGPQQTPTQPYGDAAEPSKRPAAEPPEDPLRGKFPWMEGCAPRMVTLRTFHGRQGRFQRVGGNRFQRDSGAAIFLLNRVGTGLA